MKGIKYILKKKKRKIGKKRLSLAVRDNLPEHGADPSGGRLSRRPGKAPEKCASVFCCAARLATPGRAAGHNGPARRASAAGGPLSLLSFRLSVVSREKSPPSALFNCCSPTTSHRQTFGIINEFFFSLFSVFFGNKCAMPKTDAHRPLPPPCPLADARRRFHRASRSHKTLPK